MPTEEQVCVLFSGVQGYLDKVVTSEIGKFEQVFLDHMRTKHSSILEELRTKRELSQGIRDQLTQILDEFLPNSGVKLRDRKSVV